MLFKHKYHKIFDHRYQQGRQKPTYIPKREEHKEMTEVGTKMGLGMSEADNTFFLGVV